LLLPRAAHANGAFPASGQILIDPSDPARMWVSTSYGFAKSTDGGASFQLVCESAIGYGGGFHPHAALTPTGALFMGLADGLAIGRGDTCAFERAAALEGSFVIDVSVDPASGRAIALVQPPNGARPYVAASDDDLGSFAKLGVDLPDKLTALTLDAAPSDPSVIYVSGVLEANPPRGVVLSSTNGGAMWQSVFVPESEPETAPFIAAVDPDEAGKLYVRLNGAPGKLFISDDFAASFEPVLETKGFLHAFKLAPDGLSAYFGGSMAGLYRLDTTTFEQTPLAPVAARCVAIDDDRLFACGEDAADGFSAGVSLDGGVTFEPVLRRECIQGILACGAGAPVTDICEPEWPAIAEVLGVEDCGVAGGGGAGPSVGGAAAGGAPAVPGGSSAGGAGGRDRAGDDGCGSCATGRAKTDATRFWLLGCIAVACRAGSSRRRSRAGQLGRQ
jgi:hypothetical protein